MRISLHVFLVFLATACSSPLVTERIITVEKQFLNFPVSETAPQTRMMLSAGDSLMTCFNIRLDAAHPDYWMFYDVSDLKGKDVTVHTETAVSGLNGIVQSDELLGEEPLYNERYRQQFHFSTRRGWINDPNGLVWYDGEYHLFYQLNPWGIAWDNMNWGHAVSHDLLHWKELPIALHQDQDGMVFSGSAIIDEKNVSGLGENAMLAFYTEEMSDGQTQYLAYSLDKGRHFTKWNGNPVVDDKKKDGSWHNRDPKVFWYDEGPWWVMVVFEKDGHSIYTSENLLEWTWQSHMPGFWECPELFELPVDAHTNKTKWVMTGASGTYMVGSFDGKQFIPESGKLHYVNGYQYAAQTYNNIPKTDGRRIQIGWSSIRKAGMPFTGFMQLPLELTLHTTPDGVRLRAFPITETNALFTQVMEAHSMTMEEANERLRSLPDMPEGFLMRFHIRFSHPTDASLSLDGQCILRYDLNFNRVGEIDYTPQSALDFEADLYVDRSSVEGFIDGGCLNYIIERSGLDGEKGLCFTCNHETSITVENLQVFSAKSIWH